MQQNLVNGKTTLDPCSAHQAITWTNFLTKKLVGLQMGWCPADANQVLLWSWFLIFQLHVTQWPLWPTFILIWHSHWILIWHSHRTLIWHSHFPNFLKIESGNVRSEFVYYSRGAECDVVSCVHCLTCPMASVQWLWRNALWRHMNSIVSRYRTWHRSCWEILTRFTGL